MSECEKAIKMESQNPVILNTCAEESDSILLNAKQIMGKDESNLIQEEYFIVSNVQGRIMDMQIIEKEDEISKLSKMCRTCAAVNDNLIPIFKGDGAEHDLVNKIHKHLPIKVFENDTLPLHICYQCAATLLAWNQLFEGIYAAQDRLLRLQELEFQRRASAYEDNSKLVQPEENVSLDSQIEKKLEEEPRMYPKSEQEGVPSPERSSNRDKYLATEVCSRSSKVEYVFEKSIPREFLDNRGLKLKILDRKRLFETKMKELKSSEDPPERIPKTLKNAVTLQDSPKNSPTSRNSRTLKSPPTSKNSTTLKNPPVSSFSTTSKDAPTLQDAATSKEPETRKESDSLVKKSSEELKISKSIDPLNCEKCGKIFRLQEGLRVHLKIHSEEKIYTCHVCGKQFRLTGSLYYHLKHVHGGVKNHACDICGRSFAMRKTMEDHRRIHTGERPYVCDSCGKSFKTKASLYIHRKIHSDDYPHQCSICKKKFRWRQQMLGHLTIHSGIKNHVCDTCGKAFGVKNDLTRHKKIHSSEKPFSCLECGVSFAQKRYLKNHERARHR